MPNSNFVALDSTEIFEGSSWTNVTPLTRQEYGLKGVSLRNIVYMIGESSYLFFLPNKHFKARMSCGHSSSKRWMRQYNMTGNQENYYIEEDIMQLQSLVYMTWTNIVYFDAWHTYIAYAMTFCFWQI